MSSALRIRRWPGIPKRLRTGRAVIENYEWYQLTLGRFLAPAECEKEGEVSYALLGPAGDQAAAAEEIAALGQALERLHAHCSDLVRADRGVAERFVALEALVELRLPAATDADAWHIVDGQLVCVGWGLEEERGPRLAELLDPEDGAAQRQRFLEELRVTFRLSGAAPIARNDAPYPDARDVLPAATKPPRAAKAGASVPIQSSGATESLLARVVHQVRKRFSRSEEG